MDEAGGTPAASSPDRAHLFAPEFCWMLRNFIGTGCLLLAMASALGAQEYRATLSGAVSDPQGAFVANAQVRVTSVETGVEYKTVSNNDGAYSIPFLAPGSYVCGYR